MRSFAPGSTAALRQQVLGNQRRRRAKGAPDISTIAVYASVFALIIAAVVVGYREPQKSTNLTNANTVNTVADSSTQTSVNEVVATNIAASIAETTNLSVAPNVANLAISAQIKNELAQSNDANISKPQIFKPTADNREIISYTVILGDTVDTLATKFSISKDTIKWANNLTSDALEPGKVLQMLPVDGVLYTVKSGDTLQSIAQKYSVDQARIVLYNDLDEAANLVVGARIILPSGNLPTQERPGYVVPYVGRGVSYNFRAGSVGNKYAPGNCTWYVYERRIQLGRPVGSFWGNARTWADAAQSTGYTVSKQPILGAVLVDEFGYFGHVAVVESVEENGDIVVSEMNNYAYGGFNRVNNRTISAGQATLYQYIY